MRAAHPLPFGRPHAEEFELIEIDRLAFLLPCRWFRIDMQLTDLEGEWIGHEFVLRFLHVRGAARLEEISTFLGVLPRELQPVLDDLVAGGGIQHLPDGALTLTHSGRAQFGEDGDIPTECGRARNASASPST